MAAFAFFWWLHLWFWVPRLSEAMTYAEELRLPTKDGAHIELRRISGDASGVPLLMVHGVAVNHRNLDGSHDASLARHLVEEGRDVWLLTLRSGLGERKTSLAAMARFDLAKALSEVAERTGHREVDYLGFSMGGMVLYGALALRAWPSEIALRKVAVMGSPARIEAPTPLRLLSRIPGLPTAAGLVPVPLRLLSRSVAFVATAPNPIHGFLVQKANLTAPELKGTLVDVIEGIPRSLLRELLGWTRGDGVFVEGTPLLAGCGEVQVPLLIVSGGADHIAPQRTVEAVAEHWGGAVTKACIPGKGHGDLALGVQARVDVYPVVAEYFCVPEK